MMIIEKTIEEGPFTLLEALTTNLGDPIKDIKIMPKNIINEWNSINRSIKEKKHNGAIVSRFEKWVDQITDFYESL